MPDKIDAGADAPSAPGSGVNPGACGANVPGHLAALKSAEFLRTRAGVELDCGAFPVACISPNGGSIAIGHPCGATEPRILSQAAKELWVMLSGARAIVSICPDGGLGAVALLQAP